MRRAAELLVSIAMPLACAGSPVEADSAADTGGSTHAASSEASSGPGGSSGPGSSGGGSSGVADTTTSAGPTGEGSEAGSSSDGSTGDPESCHLLLDEVLNDVPGGDGNLEWIELYNPCHTPIDLRGYSLGWGGTTYESFLDLAGTVPAEGCFVVGGPDATSANGMPTFDQAIDLAPDLQNGGEVADGIALFDVESTAIQDGTVPIDALIYGTNNDSGLLDENGEPGAPDAPETDDAHVYARLDPRVGDGWAITITPSPGTCPNPPPR